MSDHETRDDDRLDREQLEAWEVEGPPAGFADRVLAARPRTDAGQPESPEAAVARGKSPAFKAAVIAVAACAAVLLFAVLRGPSAPAVSGRVEADDRTAVRLGHRGVAVAEPGAVLSWRVESNGAARLEQLRGSVFYRVDRGGAFEVITPEGRVLVTGTCFRVEVPSMRAKDALLGAAAGALLVVTVYEGRVLFADDSGASTEAGAGQKVVVGKGEGPRTLSVAEAGQAGEASTAADEQPWEKAPLADASREELLARDEAQRAQIVGMKGEIATLQRDLAAARKSSRAGAADDDGDGRPWFDPSPELLQEFAKKCQVRFDVPPVMEAEPFELPASAATARGLTEAERVALNAVMGDLLQRWQASVRKLYVEATGDARGADSLSVTAMAEEIENKSMPGEATRILTRLSQERAGLLEPPADFAGLSPLERYYRGMGSLGDETERMLADRVGAERAREIREIKDGWGSRWSVSGCAAGSAPK